MTAVVPQHPPEPRVRLDDRLNPLLVKEARQSVRSPIFVVQTCVLQGVLVFVTALDMFRERRFGPDFFWVALGITVLLLIPLRAGTILREARQRNLELVGLTRLTSWDIVVGKWLSCVAQAMLVVTSVLPYLVLRYFNIGADVLNELLLLGVLTLGSMLASATFLCNFTMRSWLMRGAMLFVTVVCVSMTFEFTSAVTIPGGSLLPDLVLFSIGAVLVLLFLITLAATALSAEGEHATIRLRLVSAGLALVTLVTSVLVECRGWVTLVAVLSSIVILTILTEPDPRLFSGCLPFVRWRGLGRLAASFFSPGWPSAVRFILLLSLLLSSAFFLAYVQSAAMVVRGSNGTLACYVLLLMLSVLNLALVPLALARAFSREKEISIGAYSLGVGLLAFLGFAGRMVEDACDSSSYSSISWDVSPQSLALVRDCLGLFPPYLSMRAIRWLSYGSSDYSDYLMLWLILSALILCSALGLLWRRARKTAGERHDLYVQAEAWSAGGSSKIWSSLA